MIENLCSDLTENRWLKDPPYQNNFSHIFHKPWGIIRQIKILENNTASSQQSGEARKPSLSLREKEKNKGPDWGFSHLCPTILTPLT